MRKSICLKFAVHNLGIFVIKNFVTMSTVEIRQKLHHYIETAHDKKLKAIYAMVEDEIGETYDYWNDAAFVAELQRRERTYLSGSAKTDSLEQSLARATKAVKRTKHKV